MSVIELEIDFSLYTDPPVPAGTRRALDRTRRLSEVIVELEQLETPYLSAWSAFSQDPTAAEVAEYAQALRAYTSAVELRLDAIASAIGTTVESLIQQWRPGEAGRELWFGALASEFLRAAQQYGVLNPHFWALRGWTGFVRSPDARAINETLGLLVWEEAA